MEPFRVVPVHPAQGRELEIIDGFPRPRFRGPAHKLSLVVAVHRLSEGIDAPISVNSLSAVAWWLVEL